MKHQKGFTLIELLIVIAIIGILAAVVIIAVNPGRQLAQANNARRTSDVNALLNALGQYAADYAGVYPAALDTDATTYQMVGTGSCPATFGTCGAPGNFVDTVGGCANLSTTLAPVYLTAIPTDPSGGTQATTQYAVQRTAGTNPRISVRACTPQLNQLIEVTR